MRRAILAFWVLGLGVCASGWGQDKYAAEPLVVLRNDRVYRMKADGTGVMEQTVAGRIQSESALKEVGVVSVPFASKSQHVEWGYARVKHADGTVVATPLANAIEVTEQVTREAPFYSDLKGMQLPLKDLRVGDTVEWQARVVMTSAEAAGNFWGAENFVTGAVVQEQSVEVDAPKAMYVNAWALKGKPAVEVDVEEAEAAGCAYILASCQARGAFRLM
jgi:hypothetical protein